MMRSRRVAAFVVGLVFLGLLTAGAASGALSGGQAGLGDGGVAQSGFESDSVSMRIDLAADGSADWTITYRIHLDDQNATEAFESVRREVEQDGSAYVSRFRDRMERTARTAENATGRGMAIENVTVSATKESLPQEYGVVRYRFTWTNFATLDGEAIRAGDAIEQLFLEDGTSLTVAWPDDYRLDASTPPADEVGEGELTWQGRRDFGPDEPSAVVVPGDGEAGAPGSGSDGVAPVIVVAVVALLLASGAWLFAHRSGLATPLGSGSSRDDDDEPAAGATGDGDGGDGTDERPADPPEELLSNEERVLRLLEDHGGRIKQQQVADELGWTAAKTSQVVGDLREGDRLDSFRLGRENVLTLPDVSVEPEGAGSDEAETDT